MLFHLVATDRGHLWRFGPFRSIRAARKSPAVMGNPGRHLLLFHRLFLIVRKTCVRAWARAKAPAHAQARPRGCAPGSARADRRGTRG